ncbi:MAG: LPXTG cell wall anchor domain-containing protein, partial [Eubacteriaceae bacterium]
RDKYTLAPIEGASVDIFVKSLGRYVFFGLTDAQGVYSLDVAFGDENSNDIQEFSVREVSYIKEEAEGIQAYSVEDLGIPQIYTGESLGLSKTNALESGDINFTGSPLYLQDNQIQWQVYKENYLPYPEMGVLFLDVIPMPTSVDVFLYQNDPDDPKKNESLGSPKTGVEEDLFLLIMGITLLVLTGNILKVTMEKRK